MNPTYRKCDIDGIISTTGTNIFKRLRLFQIHLAIHIFPKNIILSWAIMITAITFATVS
jgi:hypothetical protein